MREITLEQLLESRENRAAFQRELIDGFALPLVSFTVNMPGAVKLDARAEYIFAHGSRALRESLAGYIVYVKERKPVTGCEGFYVVDRNAHALKRSAAQIEQTHPLGRLFDIDVLGADGAHISREAVGLPRRACLVCGKVAAGCVRSRAHTLEQLHAEIDKIIEAHKRRP